MYNFDQYFGSKSRHNKTVDFFHQLVWHILCKLFVQWHPINAQNLQT